MAERSPLFLGLVRPPKLLGLPIMYAMVWLFGSTLLFLWVQSWVVAVFAGLAWPEAADAGSVTSRLHLPTDTWRSHTEEAIETQLGEWDFRFKQQAKQLQSFVDTVQGEVRQLLGDDPPPPPTDPSP